MFEITSGKIAKAQKVVVYGVEGVGKSTFASMFPNPLFIDGEGSTNNMDVRRLNSPTSWNMLMQQLEWVKNNKPCETLVLDTADWIEENLCKPFIVSTIPNSKGVFMKNIEEYGYGAGYKHLGEVWGRDLLNKVQEIVNDGINVVILAHAILSKFEQPDEIGAYDKWSLKLEKKTAALTKEWADLLIFANFKTDVIISKDKMNKNKVQGNNRRVMYTTHYAAWDAKNRHDLPGETEFNYKNISFIFDKEQKNYYKDKNNKTMSVAKEHQFNDVRKEMLQDSNIPKDEVVVQISKEEFEEINDGRIPFDDVKQEDLPPIETEIKNKALADLMRINKISKNQIEAAVAFRGFMPKGMDLNDYPKDFTEQMLVGQFDRVKQIIIKNNL